MNKRIVVAGIGAIALIAFFSLFYLVPKAATGFFPLYFQCNNNGLCNPGETYQNCPQDCCSAQCTACTNPNCTATDGVCRSECFVPGTQCSVFRSACSGLAWGSTVCYDAASTVACCSGTPQACGSNNFCSNGSCVPCSNACDASCQSSACYPTDPDCDSSGGTTGACCGNNRCDGTDTCVTCPVDCPGAVVCDKNADCVDDGNSLTVEFCSNPGACDANCSRLACPVACDNNSACNTDNNALTVDVCNNPGTCNASCSRTVCPVRCTNNAACDDGNPLTTDVCNNPGTCSASCSNTACPVACNDNAGCNDNNVFTTDVCLSPSSCSASCSNVACPVVCSADLDCDDDNAVTVDKCENAGTCSASCSNVACPVVCSADLDCDDNDTATVDKCVNGSACNASCTHLPSAFQPSVSGQQALSIEFVGDFDKVFSRGSIVDLNLVVRDERGKAVSDAVVSLTDPNGNEVSLNSAGNGYYTGQYNVSFDFPVGLQQFSFSAEKGNRKGAEELALDVNKGAIKAILLLPAELEADVGKKIEFRFRLVYDNNSAVGKADVNAVLNGISIPLQFDGNIFTGYYLFSERDIGDANLLISAVDSFANSGTTVFAFTVERPLQLFAFFLWLILLIVLLVALYSLYRLRHLFSLEHKRGKLVVAKRQALLQHAVAEGFFSPGFLRSKKAVAKEKGRKEKLQKEIKGHEGGLQKISEEISVERKRHVVAWSRLPSELRYSAHKVLVGLSLLPGKAKQLFLKPRGVARAVEHKKRLNDIDSEIVELRERIQNLETEFCKQTIKEDYFREKLFEFREKIHFLELEKTKLS